eukprot:299219-Chlamydomonas_euryale.AAC.3
MLAVMVSPVLVVSGAWMFSEARASDAGIDELDTSRTKAMMLASTELTVNSTRTEQEQGQQLASSWAVRSHGSAVAK